jgi:photosystem II stability/assembly factor-like uncharacterized protein
MERNFGRTALIFLCLFFLGACGSDTSNTPANMIGWAVGRAVNGFGTILHTDNGGKTWTRQGDASQLPDTEFNDICILDPQTLLVSGGTRPDGTYTVYKSHDGGKNWARINSASLADATYNGLFALGKDHVWIVGDSGTIYRSDDQGDSWMRIGVPTEYQSDRFLRIAARDVNDLWVVGDKDVSDDYPIMLHTTDGGKTWERLNPVKDLQIQGAVRGHFLGIKLFGDSVWAVGGLGKFVIRSGDKGKTWSLIKKGGDFDANDIFVLSETEAYTAEDNSGVFHTHDAGLHWDDYSYPTGNWYLGIAVLGKNNIWVVGGPNEGGEHAKIIHSSDGGHSWQEQTAQVLEEPLAGLYKVRLMLQ